MPLSDISKWLSEIGFDQYSDTFEKHDIGIDIIHLLNEAHLREIGVTLGDALRILNHISSRPKADQPSGTGVVGDSNIGSALAATSQQAERRQLTVMFCDLVGSTELSSRLDPEDLRDIISEYHKSCGNAVEQFGGYIAKYMGDGVLAYFGYPNASEHDAGNAIHSASAIVASVGQLIFQDQNDSPFSLEIRVGISTGVVVVGDLIGEGSSREHNVVGETPNLAARLQGLATPGQIMVSDVTRALASDAFSFSDHGSKTIKGFAEPVRVWSVEETREVDSQSLNHDTIALVGRNEELGLLKRAWQEVHNGAGQVVLLSGEPGIGKSRLTHAIREEAEKAACHTVTLRCTPYHTSSPYYPVALYLRRAIGWKPEDSYEQRVEKLASALRRIPSLPENSFQLFAMLLELDLPDARYEPMVLTQKQKSEQTQDVLTIWINEVSGSVPSMWIWEDLHWADPSTLDLINREIDECPMTNVLNILTFRPEFEGHWGQRTHITPIVLNHLQRNEIEQLVANRAGHKKLPDEVVEHIVQKTDGVPLYAEELTSLVVGADFLRDKGDHYELTRPLQKLSIPATLQDSLMARLDSLPRAREVAQLGAVVGREFGYKVISMSGIQGEDTLRKSLQHLVDEELLYQRGRPPNSRYVFKHALILDMAYQSLLKSKRQAYHQTVAEYFEANLGSDSNIRTELIAHHFSEAGNPRKSAECWLKAGQQAYDNLALRESLSHFRAGLAQLRLLPESEKRDRLELEYLVRMGSVAFTIIGHGSTEFRDYCLSALELAKRYQDPREFQILFSLWRHSIARVILDDADKYGQALVKSTGAESDTILKITAHYTVAVTRFFHGDLHTAKKYFDRCLVLREDVEDSELSQLSPVHDYSAASGPGTMGAYVSVLLGAHQEALERTEESLSRAMATSSPFTKAFCHLNASRNYYLLGEFEPALNHSGKCRSLCDEYGFPHLLAGSEIMGAYLNFDADRFLEVVDGRLHAWYANAQLFFSFHSSLIIEACIKTGALHKGLKTADEALSVTTRNRETWFNAELYRLKGDMLRLIDPGKIEEIVHNYDLALETAKDGGAKFLELKSATSIAELYCTQLQFEPARETIQRIVTQFDDQRVFQSYPAALEVAERLGVAVY